MPSSLPTVLAVLVASAIAAGAAPSLTVKTSAPNVEVDGFQNLKVTVTVLNTGDEVLKLLNDPRGVLSSFSEDSFIVTNANGTHPSFGGASVNYDPTYAAGLDDPGVFTVLAPGASTNITHDLSVAYDFTRSGAGDYSIKPSNLFTYVDASGTLKDLYAAIEDVAEVKLSGNLAVSRRVYDKRQDIEFENCTMDEESAIRHAAFHGDIYAQDAYEHLKSISSPTLRYSYWFGIHTPPRKGRIQSHFAMISHNKLLGFVYVCRDRGCEPTFHAFVYRDQYGVIYICDRFWALPYTGAKSRAGTLVHESSHFTVHGGAWDFAKRLSCPLLAMTDPDRAAMNAESHEAFAENDPYLP